MGNNALGQAFCNGLVDRVTHGLLRVENLYRRTRWHRIAWRLGWELGNVLTTTPLRTAKRQSPLTKRTVPENYS